MHVFKRYNIVHGSRKDKFRLWNLSDIHLMSRGCSEEKFIKDVKEIRDDPFSFWVGGGDYCDFIGYRDKRFDPDAVAEHVTVRQLSNLGMAGAARFIRFTSSIANKCIGLLIGNHEKSYELATEHEVVNSYMCARLGVEYLHYCCMGVLAFCRCGKTWTPRYGVSMTDLPTSHNTETFTLFVHHGAGYAQTPGGKLNKLIQFMQSFEADIYLCGHVHDKVSRSEPTLGLDRTGKKVIQYERVGAVSGSYLKTYTQGYTSYGEMKGYRPTSLGAAVIEIEPETREIKG